VSGGRRKPCGGKKTKGEVVTGSAYQRTVWGGVLFWRGYGEKREFIEEATRPFGAVVVSKNFL